jgi:UPF0755 protein
MPKIQTKPRSTGKKSTGGHRLRWLLLVLLVPISLLTGALAWWAHQPVRFTQSPVDVHVERGTSLRGVVRNLQREGIDLPEPLFVLLARVLAADGSIKAGSYELRAGLSPMGILETFVRGDVSQAELVIPEGWTFRQVRARVDAHPALTHLTAGMDEETLLRRLGVSEATAEGLFFPDKYLFDKRSSDLDLYARAFRMTERRLETLWAGRDSELLLKTPYEALILASIVEKETGRDSERPMIASVFLNRLRIGMPLQTDPTVIYGLGERFDGNLRKRDLLADTPYNTYTRNGLPPTPIAMPGEASLRAVLNPLSSKALYFVARGDGSSEFSETLDAHNRAVNRYQRGGR